MNTKTRKAKVRLKPVPKNLELKITRSNVNLATRLTRQYFNETKDYLIKTRGLESKNFKIEYFENFQNGKTSLLYLGHEVAGSVIKIGISEPRLGYTFFRDFSNF